MSYVLFDVRYRIRHAFSGTYDIARLTYDVVYNTYDVYNRTTSYRFLCSMSYVTSYVRYRTYDVEYDIVRPTYDVVGAPYDIVRSRTISYLARIQMPALAAL